MASIWTSAAQAEQQGFVESYYLGAKAALLTTQTGTTWTVDMVKAAFASAGLEAYQHYQQYGFMEGLNPNQYFSESYYNTSKATAAGVTESAFQTAWNNTNGGSQTSTYFHYLQYGFNEAGVNPSATFSEAQYYADKAALLTAQTGQTWTVAQVQAVFAQNGLTPITHYLLYGGTPSEPTPQPVNGGSYDLTTSADVKTANVFNSVPAWSPGGDVLVNTLQNIDKLTGTGTNPTLNVQLGDASAGSGTTITPTLTGIQTINAAFVGSTGAVTAAVNTLDMQDATGATALNITRISDGNNAAFTNIASVPANLSLSNTNSPVAGTVTFRMLDSAVTGDTDTTTMTLNNANAGNLIIQGTTAGFGVETVNLVSSTSANAVGTLWVDDVKTLNISGTQNLSIGDIEYGAADGDFTTIDGSKATGNLTLTIDDDGATPGLNSAMRATTGTGTPVAFNLTTGSGNDTLNVTATAQVIGTTNDTIDLGTGTDTVAFNAATTATFTDATSAVFNGVEQITVTNSGAAASANNIAVDSSRLTGDQAITLTNAATGAVASSTFTLNSLSATEAATGLTIKHSSTGNNALGQNLVVADTTGDTLGITIANGSNSDPLFNFQLQANAASINNVTLTDTDTESNTVRLMDENGQKVATPLSVSGLTGTITVTGGQAGQYMNLDATATVGGNNNSVGGYGYTTNGLPLNTALGGYSSLTTAIAAANTTDSAVATALSSGSTIAANQLITASKITATGAASDVIVRVGQANQTINLGTGNDTVIFADRAGTTKATAGLSVADTVVGGTGSDTVVLDGTGAQTLGDSEWTNLSGIDTVRLAGVAGASTFTLRVSNHLVDQTDSGSLLNIVNNDGNLATNAENNANIDLRNVNATNFVNFVGANGNGSMALGTHAIQTVLVNDVTANGNNFFNGGDNDVVTTYTNDAAGDALWAANYKVTDGNTNVYSVYNTSEVTIGDLANTKNFSTITFHNDQAVNQTLSLTLDNTTVDSLVDASHTATTTQVEVLTINVAEDSGKAAILNIDASTVGAQFSLDITGGSGNDTIVEGASVDTIVGNAGTDTVSYASSTAAVTVNLTTNTNTGGYAQGDSLTGIESVIGSTYNDTLTGGAAAATLTGGAGADTMTAGAAATTFNYGTLATVNAQTGITLATADTIGGFTSGTDFIKTGTAGTVGAGGNYVEAAAAANFATALANADTAMDGTVRYYLTSTAADGGLLFVDSNGDGNADALIKLTGIDSTSFANTDIVA